MRPFDPHPLRHRVRGFTLIEALVTITILIIIVAFSYPAMQRTIRNNRVATVASDLRSTLIFARTEAIRRNACVAICTVSSNTSTTCNDTDSNGAADWLKGGVMVFAYPSCTLDTSNPIQYTAASAASTPILKRTDPKDGMHAFGAITAYAPTVGNNTYRPTSGNDATSSFLFNARGNVIAMKTGGNPAPMDYFIYITPDVVATEQTKNDKVVCATQTGDVYIKDFGSIGTTAAANCGGNN